MRRLRSAVPIWLASSVRARVRSEGSKPRMRRALVWVSSSGSNGAVSGAGTLVALAVAALTVPRGCRRCPTPCRWPGPGSPR